MPPGRPFSVVTPHSGTLTLNIPKTATYQVTISADGWIDVVQNGVAVKASAHTGDRLCLGLRKSVRFPLHAGPAIVQVSGAPENAIRIAIRRSD